MLQFILVGFLNVLVTSAGSRPINFSMEFNSPSCLTTIRSIDVRDISLFGTVAYDPDISVEELNTINKNLLRASEAFNKSYPTRTVIQHSITVVKCNCKPEDGQRSGLEFSQKQLYTKIVTTIEGLSKPIRFKYPSGCSLQISQPFKKTQEAKT